MDTLEGKLAVVTGAASGVGAALARALDSQGMQLVLADVEADKLRSVADELSRTPVCHALDVADEAAVAEMAASTYRQHENVHLLINNAGVMGPMAPVWELEDSDWQWVLGVNVRGVANAIRAFVPEMINQPDASHIVNTASEASFACRAFVGVYHASKHALLALTETLAQELEFLAAPIRVSVLCPGPIDTAIMSADRNRPSSLASTVGLNETGEKLQDVYRRSLRSGMAPEDVAAAVIEGIRQQNFYILPHKAVADLPGERADAVRTDRYPELSTELAELLRTWQLKRSDTQ